ncbi:Rv0361 family membrane protein [Modestobacter lacusdianchii]
MTQGPFLYDDDPAPLHTGTPRNRNGTLLALLGATVLIAVLMVGGMTLYKGSGEDQSREVAGVFAAALSQGDVETAYGLICDDVRARVAPDQLVEEFLQPGTPEVTGSRETEVDGEPAQLVQVRWDDGGAVTTTELTVVPEGGTKVCGTSAAG